MRTIRKCVICGCCKQKVEVPIMLSRYLGATGLDNRPCNEAELPVVQKCSRCGYCNFSIEGEIADKTRKVIASEEYQRHIKRVSDDEYGDKLQAMLLYLQSIQSRIYVYLLLCWHYEWKKDIEMACEMRRHAVQQMELAFRTESEIRVEEILIYIDCLRQLGRFEEAKETVESIETEVCKNLAEDQLLFQVYRYQKTLIEKGDAFAHTVAEV